MMRFVDMAGVGPETDAKVQQLIAAIQSGAINRRQFMTSALASGLSVAAAIELLTACGQSPAATPTPGQINTAATIRMAYGEDDWAPNGVGVKSTTYMYQLNMNVYEPLIYLGSDYSLKPGLATSWEMTSPTVWRFHLRQGVKWQDGTAFSADDVLYTWGTRQKQGATLSTVASTLDTVNKIDQYTIDFVTKTPNYRLSQQIVHPEGAIVQVGKNFDSSPAIGTGPFKVLDYTASQGAHFQRWDGYWGQKAQVAAIDLRFIPDDQTRIQALQSGQVDYIIGVPPLSVAPIKQNSKFRIIEARSGRNQLIYIDKDGVAPHTIGADPAVRQAVTLSIDRTAYVKTVFDNNADPGHWMAPQYVLGQYASTVTAPSYNPTKAKQVLDAAGWTVGSDGIRVKNGQQLALDLIGWAEVTPQAFQFLQSQLQQVGIKVNIKQAADTPTYNNYYKNAQFDLDLEVPNQNDANPAFLPVLRMYSKNTGTSHFAPGGQFDVLAQQSFTATMTAEVQQLSAQMMQLLINQEYIVVPLAGVRRIHGMSSHVFLGDPHPSLTNQTWVSLVSYK